MFTGMEQQLSDLLNYSGAPLYWIWNLAVYGSLAGLVVLAGPVARRPLRSAAAAVFIGVVAFAVALPLLNFAEGHYDFYTPARYALPLLPIVGLVLARSMRLRGLVLVGAVLPGQRSSPRWSGPVLADASDRLDRRWSEQGFPRRPGQRVTLVGQ